MDNLCDDCKTMHTCRICGITEQCRDEIDPGMCDFRVHTNSHGECMGRLTLKEKMLFFFEDFMIVEQTECSGCGNGFAVNTYCAECVERAK